MIKTGQYHIIINLTKREYLHPHNFGDGLKLMEFGLSQCGTMSGLAILLSNSNGRGGGDLDSRNPIVGSWAGDNIVIVGDYADKYFIDGYEHDLFSYVLDNFKDISFEVIDALCDDEYAKYKMKHKTSFVGDTFDQNVYDYAMQKLGKEVDS